MMVSQSYRENMSKKIIITGTMGAGKTSLLKQLSDFNFPVVPECARVILAEQRSFSGHGVPEDNPSLFCELLLSRTLYQYKVESSLLVLFDRGLPDIIAYASFFNLDLTHYKKCAALNRYQQSVFLLEPWQDIYENDDERKMSFDQAQDFHQRLVDIYQSLNYDLCIVPKGSILQRADFVRALI